jgi:hypothetical protein
MASKEQVHSRDTSTAKQRPPQHAAQAFETVDWLHHPATIVQRAARTPGSLTPEDVLRLQRTVGNRASLQLPGVGRTGPEAGAGIVRAALLGQRRPRAGSEAPVQRQEEEEEPLQSMALRRREPDDEKEIRAMPDIQRVGLMVQRSDGDKREEFETRLGRIKTVDDLIGFFTEQGQQALSGGRLKWEDVSSCSGTTQLVAEYFLGKERGIKEYVAAQSIDDRGTLTVDNSGAVANQWKEAKRGVAIINTSFGSAHEFSIVVSGGRFSMYQGWASEYAIVPVDKAKQNVNRVWSRPLDELEPFLENMTKEGQDKTEIFGPVLAPTERFAAATYTYRFVKIEDTTSKEVPQLIKKKKWSWGGCYITTACLEARGLPDNCDELTTLRRFRDGYMRGLESGDALIRLYYDIAPQIVAAIAARQDAKKVYEHLYSVIQTCVEHVKSGSNEKALAIYVEMVKKLTRQYCPHLLPDALRSAA